MEPADGLVIIYARLRNPDIRVQFWSRMEGFLGERLSPTVFEFRIDDWDEGAWQEEVEWVEELLSGTRESVTTWLFRDGKYARYSITGAG
jgi:hypothetical protein